MAGQAQLQRWAVRAVRELGGSAHHVEVAKWIWKNHRNDLHEAGDMFYTWQYTLRWAGTNLRQIGAFKPASECPQGTWRLTKLADELYPEEE